MVAIAEPTIEKMGINRRLKIMFATVPNKSNFVNADCLLKEKTALAIITLG